MKPIRLYIGILFISLLFSACKTQLSTTRPQESYLPPTVAKKSTVAVKLHIDIAKLEQSLNQSLAHSVYEDNRFDDDHWLMKVTKANNLQFAVNGNELRCTLPLKVWVKTGYKKNILGLTIEDYYEANGAVTVMLTVKFAIDKHWNLVTNSTIERIHWTSAPKISTGHLNIPVETLSNLTIKIMRDKIESSIDKAIAKQVNLPKIMTDAWAQIQKPILLDNEYNAWLTINPSAVYSTPISGNGRYMDFTLGMEGILSTTVGTPPTEATKSSLPEYKIAKHIAPNFSLNTDIQISFEKMSQLAHQLVVGQEFSSKGMKVRIDSLRLFGQNDKLVVEAHVSGSAKGTIYCLGTPIFDKQTQTLRIENFDFELNTRNALLKSANWLLHKQFLSKIEPMLTIPLEKEIATITADANKTLEKYLLLKGIFLNGKINGITFEDIHISPEALYVTGIANGNITISINEIF